MKLRIRGNSIRLRLLRSEVRKLLEHGRVVETTTFSPTTVFEYGIVLTRDGTLTAQFDAGVLIVAVPRPIAETWSKSDEVAIESRQGDLKILIEKDFACGNPSPDEPQDDAFPNPNPCD